MFNNSRWDCKSSNPHPTSPTVHRLAVLGDTKAQHYCDICQQRFTHPFSFIRHERTHTEEKPYACDWGGCNKRFSQSSNLNTHKDTHTGNCSMICLGEQKPTYP